MVHRASNENRRTGLAEPRLECAVGRYVGGHGFSEEPARHQCVIHKPKSVYGEVAETPSHGVSHQQRADERAGGCRYAEYGGKAGPPVEGKVSMIERS